LDFLEKNGKIAESGKSNEVYLGQVLFAKVHNLLIGFLSFKNPVFRFPVVFFQLVSENIRFELQEVSFGFAVSALFQSYLKRLGSFISFLSQFLYQFLLVFFKCSVEFLRFCPLFYLLHFSQSFSLTLQVLSST